MSNEGESHTDDGSWLHTVRLGAGLVFWFMLLPVLLTNVGGFILPFVGGERVHLEWIGLPYTLGGIGLLVGILKLTAVPASRESSDLSLQRAGKFLRSFAWVDMITRVMRFIWGPSGSACLGVPILAVELGWAISGAAFLTYLCRRIGVLRLNRELYWATAMYITKNLLMVALAFNAVELSATLPGSIVQVALLITFQVWALSIVWRFRRCVIRICEGQCVSCGYILQGLPEPRCPECGTQALLHGREEHQENS